MGQSVNAPRSSIPSRLPTSGGGGWYIAGIVGLLLLIVGLVVWKFTRSSPPVAQTTVIQSNDRIDDSPQVMNIPPPPELEAGVDAEPDAKGKTAVAAGENPCSGTCNGDAPAALRSALSGAGAASRGCYERALRTDPSLQGKVVVSVRISATGSVCSASIAQNTVGSAGVGECVLGLFRGKSFPPVTGGKCADVSVPISFTPRENKK